MYLPSLFVCFQYLPPASADTYMHIVASETSDILSTARLMSLPQPAGQPICLSFRYRIFGNSIGMCWKVSKHF